MTDWAKLEHAYGSAEDIPEILARLSPDPDSRAMDELWERVCLFGEVYSASLPVLPYLLEIISTWEALLHKRDGGDGFGRIEV